MAFSDFTKDVSRILSRSGSVFVSDDDGTTWYDLGNVKNVQMQTSANNTEANSQGKIKQLSSNITTDIVLQQTDVEEFDNLDLLTDPTDDGLWCKITDDCATAATAGAAAGKTFKGVNFTFDTLVDWNGGESTIALKFTGRVSNSDFTDFGTTGELVFC